MKSISNKVLFGAVKKFLAVLIFFSFILPQHVSAGTPQQRIKSNDEIKIMLISSDKYVQSAGIKNVLAWSLIVVAVGRVAYGFGKTDKGLKSYDSGFEVGKGSAMEELKNAFKKEKLRIETESFNRGFSAGQESMNDISGRLFSAGKKTGYKKGYEQAMKQAYLNRSSGLKSENNMPKPKLNLTKAERRALADFEKQVKYLEVKLSTPTGVELTKNKVMVLVMRASNQTEALKAASTPQEISIARNELLTTIERISETKMPDAGTRTVVKEYLKELSSVARGKGGVIGMTAVAVVAAGAMLVCSQEAHSADISNTRLLVARELARTAKHSPDLIAVKTLSLKNTYGVDIVSSVLYEHQELLPAIEQQFAFFKSSEIRQVSSDVFNSFYSSAASAARNKTLLLNSLR